MTAALTPPVGEIEVLILTLAVVGALVFALGYLVVRRLLRRR